MKEKQISIGFIDLGQEIILQIFGNITFRAVQKVSRALKGELKRELEIKTFPTFIRKAWNLSPVSNTKFVCKLANFRTAIDLSVLFREPVWTGPQAKTDYHENN